MPHCACLLPDDLPAAELPSAFTRLLEQFRADQVGCRAVGHALAAAWGIPEPLRAAIFALATAADRSGIANSYHNPAHTRDVAINWANLAMLNNALAARGGAPAVLGTEDLALGLHAAFGHDLLHDGIGNVIEVPSAQPDGPPERRHIAFRLERISADHTEALLRTNGVGPDLVAAVTAAILATEPVHGLASLEAAEPLRRPAWRVLTLMLRDADVLASVGLTAAEHDRQSALLGVEFGTDLNTPDAAETLFALAAAERFRSPSGALFLTQFQTLRSLNRLRGRVGGCLSLEAAGRRLAGS